MRFKIVCFVGEYAICKNEKTEEVFNIARKEVLNFKEGDEIILSNGKYTKSTNKDNDFSWDRYYVCDDILIEINDKFNL